TKREIGADDLTQLHERHLSAWRMSGGPAEITDRLADKLQDLVATLDDALDCALAERDALLGEARDLTAPSALPRARVPDTVDRLMHAVRDTQARFSLLDARLRATVGEIGALQRQLETVRAHCQSDPMTSLPNRSSFERLLAALLAQTQQERAPL